MITLTLTWLTLSFTFQLVLYRKRSWSLTDVYNLHTQSYVSCLYFAARINRRNYAAPLEAKTATKVWGAGGGGQEVRGGRTKSVARCDDSRKSSARENIDLKIHLGNA